MLEAFWNGLNGLDLIFFLSAVVGGGLFILRGILSLFVGDHDPGAAGDALGGFGDSGELHLISLHTLTVFFLLFGLAGLALHRGSQLGEAIAITGAFAVAACVVLLIAKLTQMFRRLDTSGTVNLNQSIGKVGTVYLNIQPGGYGKVQIDFNEHLMTLDAAAEDKEAIKTGERIEVVDVLNGTTLIVKKV